MEGHRPINLWRPTNRSPAGPTATPANTSRPGDSAKSWSQGTVAVMAGFVAASASGTSDLFGGANLLQLLVLALGGALVVGNTLALVRPPGQTKQGQLARPPTGRAVVMIVIGAIAAIWSIATLAS
jgi:hypothetical protein